MIPMGSDELVVLFLLLLVGMIYAACGALLYKYPPKNINHFFGYRTGRAMKDQRSWDFAQVYSGKMMIYWGMVTMVLGFAVWMVFPDDIMIACIVVILQTVLIFPAIIATERKLKMMQEEPYHKYYNKY